MKKYFLFMMILFLMGVEAKSQSILYQDNFESYTVGSYLAVDNPAWWTTWDNQPGSNQDAKIVDTYGHSPTKSFNPASLGGSHTDLILKLGNRVSGKYELTWWMYVDAPNAAYYNMQHYESPGIEWAYDVFFYINGTGALMTGGDSVNFTYPKTTWFEVRQVFDLNQDSASIYINGVKVNQWPFSYTSNNTNGTNQIGGIDFYSESSVYTYFVDDLTFTETSPPTDAIIVVSPDSIGSWMAQGGSQSIPLMITDSGVNTLTYQTFIVWDSIQDLGLPSDTGTLHYDSENANAIGWNTVPTTVTAAARYTYQMTGEFAGMRITSVDVYINNLNTSGSNLMTLKIWEMGNNIEPGALVYQQDFTPAGSGWEHIVLTTPVFVSGADVWVGYTFTQAETGIYIPGVDAGPANPNGDFLSTGVGWSHLSENPALNYNWNIRAHVEGARIPQWFTVTPDTGSVAQNQTDTLLVTMNYGDTLPTGRYTATIRILSNDPMTPSVDVPVVLDVVGVGVADRNNAGIKVYPNPATDILNISADYGVSSYVILDLSGRQISTGKNEQINLNSLSPGVYILQAKSEKGSATIRFVKR